MQLLKSVVIAVAAWGIWISSAAAIDLDPAQEQQAHQIFQAIMSPFCPGRSLQDCPSGKAAELKNEIRKKILTGMKSDDILEEIFITYGDEISAVPQNRGFGRVAWYTPVLFIVGGLIVIGLWLKLRSAPQTGKTTEGVIQLAKTERQPDAIDPEMQARIDAELRD